MSNVLTGISIAAGSGLHQKAIFIGQLYRQAVQLEHQYDELAHADGRLLSRCQRLGENSASDSAAVVG